MSTSRFCAVGFCGLFGLLATGSRAGGGTPPSGSASTEVGGLICEDTTWTADASPYRVTSSIIVGCGATLTIEPGARVCFPRGLLGVAIGSGAFGQGTLVARGRPDAPIIFTSCEPDAQLGDWVSINFTDAAVDATFDLGGNYVDGSILEHVIVEYAGAGQASGAVTATASSPYIAHSIIRNNAASGVYVRGDQTVPTIRIEGNTITGNVAQNIGGGVVLLTSPSGILTGNTISRNISHFWGGGVYVHSSSPMLTGNTITGNNTQDGAGGGVCVVSSSAPRLTGNTITGNTTAHSGGGVYVEESPSAELIGNTIIGNTASYIFGGGGGVALSSSSSATLTDNVILRNTSEGPGGGLFVSGSPDCAVRDCVFGNNAATNASAAGGIHVEGSPGLTLTGAHEEGRVVLLGNSGFDVFNGNAFGPIENDVVAEHVWWGTRDPHVIDDETWDFFDDATRAFVIVNPPAATGPFDFNGDGEIRCSDVPTFVECLGGPDAPIATVCALGDLDRDGDVDLFDFAAFQTVVRGGPSPCPPAVDCDDGLFCNGLEYYANGGCASWIPPCPDDCCEATDTCGPCGPCPNGCCDTFENACTCPLDCGQPPGTETRCCDGIDNDCDQLTDGSDPDCAGLSCCGNGQCEAGEDYLNCPGDCRAGCGDGICDHACFECESCPEDCAPCGDGHCQCGCGETPVTCPQDCSPCGDGICGECESCYECPQDCSPCGDGVCQWYCGEDCRNCEQDCGADCGDHLCECGCGENHESCPGDCPGYCGDGLCGAVCENECRDCPADCGTCGDGTCNPPCENCSSCQVDCGPCCAPVCGDGICEGFCSECDTCPEDCGRCGDGVCGRPWPCSHENCSNCGKDCPPECGDRVCERPCEDHAGCPSDCGECGNGLCESWDHENCLTCDTDCLDRSQEPVPLSSEPINLWDILPRGCPVNGWDHLPNGDPIAPGQEGKNGIRIQRRTADASSYAALNWSWWWPESHYRWQRDDRADKAFWLPEVFATSTYGKIRAEPGWSEALTCGGELSEVSVIRIALGPPGGVVHLTGSTGTDGNAAEFTIYVGPEGWTEPLWRRSAQEVAEGAGAEFNLLIPYREGDELFLATGGAVAPNRRAFWHTVELSLTGECGNGVCDPGENACNCEQDCVGGGPPGFGMD